MGMMDTDLESLRIQLVELNNRARWYSSQLWQIPFLYFGVCSVLLGAITEGDLMTYFFTTLFVAFIGPFIIWHMHGISNGEMRAVLNLETTEKALGLPNTVQYRKNYTHPLQSLVILLFVASTLATLGIVGKLIFDL